MISEQNIKETFQKYNSQFNGKKEDYFSLLYLSKEFNKPIEDIAKNVVFGNYDFGIDAFYIHEEKRNLYLYQFKWSENHKLFEESFERLIKSGMEMIFGFSTQDKNTNPLINELKAQLSENRSIVNKVFIYFVFNGDSTKAENSSSLKSYVEDLEDKQHLISKYFEGRDVSLSIQFISNQRSRSQVGLPPPVHKYEVSYNSHIEIVAENNSKLTVCFASLFDIYQIFKNMGIRFLSRNIRTGLDSDKAPNRALRNSFKRIILTQQESPDVFVFNHNGITIAVEKIEVIESKLILTEPRLLNGAQTITSFEKFLEDNKTNDLILKNIELAKSIKVLTKLIKTDCYDFITNVTICNNKQNPVSPINLRANDILQLKFEDKFKDDLNLYYERQEKAFESLSDSELEEMDIDIRNKPIEIEKLAKTFLALQGEIDSVSRTKEIFEDEKTYRNTFKDTYLESDSKKVILLYKVQFRLRRIIREIIESGENKYWFISQARNLVWALIIQGIVNDSKYNNFAEKFGAGFTGGFESDYLEAIKKIASSKVRFIIREVIDSSKNYQGMLDNEKYAFFRTKKIYADCMAIAKEKYGWEKRTQI